MRTKLILWLIDGFKDLIPADDLGEILASIAMKIPDTLQINVSDLRFVHDSDEAWDGLHEFAVEQDRPIRMLN